MRPSLEKSFCSRPRKQEETICLEGREREMSSYPPSNQQNIRVHCSYSMNNRNLKQFAKEKRSRSVSLSTRSTFTYPFHAPFQPDIFDDSIPPTWPHIKKVDRDNIVIGFFLAAIVSCIWWSKGCITSISSLVDSQPPSRKYTYDFLTLSLSISFSLLSKD